MEFSLAFHIRKRIAQLNINDYINSAHRTCKVRKHLASTNHKLILLGDQLMANFIVYQRIRSLNTITYQCL